MSGTEKNPLRGRLLGVGLGLVAVVCYLVLAITQHGLESYDHGMTGQIAKEPLTNFLDAPIELVDMAGRTIVLNGPAKRIVLVKGRDVHELYMLLGDELDERLIGWGRDVLAHDKGTYDALVDHFPRLAEIPLTGSIYRDPVVEQLLTLNPDLVVVDTVVLDGAARECVEQMEAVGLPLLFIEMSDAPFKGPIDSLMVLGEAVGKRERAQQIKSFVDEQLRKVDERLPETIQGPSVYIECAHLGVDKWGHTFGLDFNGRAPAWGAFLERLHCENVAVGVVPFKGRIHPEYLLEVDPQVIVLTGSRWTASPDSMTLGLQTTRELAQSRLQGFVARPGWKSLAAVKEGNMHSLYHGFCMHPDSFAAFQWLAKWCYPDRFSDLQPEDSLYEFHRRFMPLETEGVWHMTLEVE